MSEAREVYCVKCGCIESAEEMVYVASEDAYYCTDCAESEGFVQCESCGSWHREIDMTEVHTMSGDEMWCVSCVGDNAFRCEHCGEVYDSRTYDSRTVNSNYFDEQWCEACVDEEAVACWDCDDLIDAQYATYIERGGYYVCNDCLDRNYTYCDDCGEYHHNSDIYRSCGRAICTDCAPYSDYWHYCEECDEYVYEDAWDYDSECCTNCIRVQRSSNNARVRSYHGDEPPMQFFGKYGDVFKGLGIELEIDRDYANSTEKQYCLNELDELLGAHAYYKYDGSLRNGIEIVTLPHTIEAFFELPWKEALEICVNRGYSSHQIGTCGLHVHLSRELFGDDEEMQSDNIAKLMQFYNIYWDDMLKVSRRTNEQVIQWAGKYPTVRKDSLKKWATKKDRYGRRYMAVNVTNDNTVEIRINRGTLKLETFLATCDFVVRTAINSTKIGWADVSDDFQWLKGLKKETLLYIQNRNAFCEPVCKYLDDYWREENERRAAEYERMSNELNNHPDDTSIHDQLADMISELYEYEIAHREPTPF